MSGFELATPLLPKQWRPFRFAPLPGALTYQSGRHPRTFFQDVQKAFLGGIYSCSKRQVRYQAALSLYFNVCSCLRWFCHGIVVLNLWLQRTCSRSRSVRFTHCALTYQKVLHPRTFFENVQRQCFQKYITGSMTILALPDKLHKKSPTVRRVSCGATGSMGFAQEVKMKNLCSVD